MPEKINTAQEKAPQLSIVEQKKMEAGKFVASRIKELMNEDKEMSFLKATHQVYEEVKGQLYREEQAVAKLLEYLTKSNEVDMQGQEIIRTYPHLDGVVSGKITNASKEAANAKRFDLDKKAA
jgi:hypothetical protein